MQERDFQRDLIKHLKLLLPGCIVMKNDARYRQGFPDLTIYYKDHYIVLECKNRSKAHRQPNQEPYVEMICKMGGYARFVYPENEEEILNEISEAFGVARTARHTKRKSE